MTELSDVDCPSVDEEVLDDVIVLSDVNDVSEDVRLAKVELDVSPASVELLELDRLDVRLASVDDEDLDEDEVRLACVDELLEADCDDDDDSDDDDADEDEYDDDEVNPFDVLLSLPDELSAGGNRSMIPTSASGS